MTSINTRDTEPFDVSKFAAELVQQNINSLIAGTTAIAGSAIKMVERKLRSTYTEYILNSAEHYGTARTFFIRDTKPPLYNYYVPLDIACGKTILKNASISQLSTMGSRAVIAGRAGCGKSTLMRHLFLDCIRNRNKIPIFIELNQVNDQESVNLWSLILKSSSKFGLKLDGNQVKRAIEDGGFALFFDGLDEVDDDRKKAVAEQIDVFSTAGKANWTIVSTRPGNKIAPLDSSNSFEVLPLSLEKAVSLVSLVPFDEEIKSKFATDLKESLFEKHKTFLANPLLLSIMLLTYGQSASIPSKVSIFFNQAYEALFQTHDAYKGGFARRRRTHLDIQEFERAFSAFSLLSYDASSITFTKTQCLDFILKSKSISQLEYSPQQFLEDCLQSVCLLMEDGLKITFVHRSFQEYFAAKCITRLHESMKSPILKRFGARSRTDNVMDRFWELDPRSCEDLWLTPTIAWMRQQVGVKRKTTQTAYLKYLRILCDEVVVDVLDETGRPSLAISYSTPLPNSETIRNAVFIVYQKYWLQSQAWRDSLNESLDSHPKLSSARVSTKKLSTRSTDFKSLLSAGWIVSIDFLSFLIELPSQIEQRRAAEVQSIESILHLNEST